MMLQRHWLEVEFKINNIKVKPNSGNFKVISDEVLKLNVGDEIKAEGNVAIVTDQHLQVDTKQVPFIAKTEFNVKNEESGTEKFLKKFGIRQSPPPSWKISKHKQNKKFLKSFGFGHDPPPFWKKPNRNWFFSGWLP